MVIRHTMKMGRWLVLLLLVGLGSFACQGTATPLALPTTTQTVEILPATTTPTLADSPTVAPPPPSATIAPSLEPSSTLTEAP
ncbi:MAG: hypothetical protein JW726_19280, partial [Anaerolineales bacterium]|nr:hypothetical protein [Anaerolineales bacterium]